MVKMSFLLVKISYSVRTSRPDKDGSVTEITLLKFFPKTP